MSHPLASYIITKDRGEQTAVVHGLEVLYVYEAPDYSVGIGPAWYVQAVRIGGEWFSAGDTFQEDFLDKLQEALPDAVREEYEASRDLED